MEKFRVIVEFVAHNGNNAYNSEISIVLLRKEYTDRELWLRQRHAVDRMGRLIVKAFNGSGIKISHHCLFPPAQVNPKRSEAAKKAVVTKKNKELNRRKEQHTNTLFPDYLTTTDIRIAILEKQLKRYS